MGLNKEVSMIKLPEPVAYITETEQGPMVWTPEMYGEACTYCDDGEFPVPLYTVTALRSQVEYLEKIVEDHAKALAQHRDQQPVCHGCGIPAGDVHMSTCKSGKWPSRVSNGDTAAPAPVEQRCTYCDGTGDVHSIDGEWRGTCHCAAAPAPQAQDALQDIAAYIGVGGYNGATTEQLSERIRVEFDRLAALQSAQPKQEPLRELTEPQVHGIAHRKATRYTYIAKPSEVMYGFSETHIVDFVRAIEKARG